MNTIVSSQKNIFHGTLNRREYEHLAQYVKQNKNVVVCGPPGVGKSFLVRSLLNDVNSIELNHETVKKLDLLEGSRVHILLEDYEGEYKSVVDDVSEGKKITKGSFIMTCRNYTVFPNFETLFIHAHTVEKLIGLIPREKRERAVEAAKKSNGNIRNFYCYLQFSDAKDIFKSPKEFAKDILCDKHALNLLEHLSEHGSIWDMIQENYLESENVDTMRASDSLSMADIYDTRIYKGDWDLMSYFILHAIVIPQTSLGKNLRRENIRPGSTWTKFGNMKMRQHKLKDIEIRTGLKHDELCLLKLYAEKGQIGPLIDYKITAQDFDIMNHITLQNKLKQKDVSFIKKTINHAYGR